MPDVTLHHCVSVPIDEPTPLPPDFEFVLTVGGGPLDGVVEVTAGPGQLPGAVSVPTASSTTIRCVGVTILFIHYKQSPAGPAEVEATYEVRIP